MHLDGFDIRPFAADDGPVVQALLESDPHYFEIVQGAPPGAAEAESLVTGLPPGKTYDDKCVYCVFAPTGTLAAVIDLVRDYPETGTWIVGLLFVAPALRHRGLGTNIAGAIDTHVARSGGRAIRIVVALENAPAHAFWERAGYRRHSGAERVHAGGRRIALEIMERTLAP